MLAGEGVAVFLIGNDPLARAQIEGSRVVPDGRRRGIRSDSACRSRVLEFEPQIAEHLVATKRHISTPAAPRSGAFAGEGLVDQCLGLAVFALGEQAADLRQRGVGSLPVVVTRRTRPDRTFVEHDPLFVHPAKDHRAEAPVAEWQRPVKARRRFVKPDGRCGIGRQSGYAGGKQDGEEFFLHKIGLK